MPCRAPQRFLSWGHQRRLGAARGVANAADARGHGLFTLGGNRNSDPATTLTTIVVAAEHYGRVARMLEKNIPVTEVAALFGVTRATVYNWMTGLTTPNPRYLAMIPKITARLSKRK